MENVPLNESTVLESVRKFISQLRSVRLEKIQANSSLFHDLGVDGDDAVDLISEFSIKFNVDMQNFAFCEYFGDEVTSSPLAFLVEILSKTKSKKLKRLEVRDLVKAALAGQFKPAGDTR